MKKKITKILTIMPDNVALVIGGKACPLVDSYFVDERITMEFDITEVDDKYIPTKRGIVYGELKLEI